MQNNYRWCEQMAYEKIAEARAGATRDRLARMTVQAGQNRGTLFTRLLLVFAGAFGLRRPALIRE